MDYSTLDLRFGHTSAETALAVEDYPYGFHLRTTIRYWIESKAKHGDRLVSQTLNPKTGRWNKPKAGTYSTLQVLYVNEEGHVKTVGLGTWPDEDQIARFCAAVGAERLNEVQKRELAGLIGRTRVFKHVTWKAEGQGTYNLSEPGELERMKADDEARKDKDAEQAAIMERIWRACAVEASQAHEALTGGES
jgi:hypothetical protein